MYEADEVTRNEQVAAGSWPMWLKVIIGLAATAVGLFALGFWMLVSTMRGDAYELAMARASTDPRVVEAFGTPIESAFFISGSVSSSDRGGVADLQIPIEGPKGTGTLLVHAIEGGGNWGIAKIRVMVDRTKSTIDVPIGGAR